MTSEERIHRPVQLHAGFQSLQQPPARILSHKAMLFRPERDDTNIRRDTMLRPSAFSFYTTRELKPAGWMLDQLRRQADGLAGNLDRVWPDVRDSAWVGGDREGWERVPYWLDGFIPLAFLLDDPSMQARARRYIDAILDRQQPDGWICPCSKEARRTYDLWAVLLICKVLSVWCDCTGDQRAQDAMHRCLLQLNTFLDGTTLHDWGAARWFEGLIPIFWLYERTKDERLLVLARKLRVQGFDWARAYDSGLIGTLTDGWDQISHIVNTAMMLKSEALYCRLGGESDFARRALAWLDEHCGTAVGIINGDECLAPPSPIRGSELCSVVEFMYSCEQLFSITGDPMWLDRLEWAGFNALPASCSPDMWAHQYDQLANQIAAYPALEDHFRTNGRESHVFGLEPNYGCCTANFGQGFPKLALTTFLQASDGIVLAVPQPARLTTTISGKTVDILCDSGYPFRDQARLQVHCAEKTEFALYIHIPGFADRAWVDGQEVTPGTLHCIRRAWLDDTVDIRFEFCARLIPRPEGLYALRRGPLVFSLPVRIRAQKVEYTRDGVDRRFPYCDYALYPNSPWNYGFASTQFEPVEHALTNPFDPATPAMTLKTTLQRVAWDSADGFCAALPDTSVTGETTECELIPYGAAKLRMTELPLLATLS